MAVEIPETEEPGIAAQVGIQKVNVAADEENRGREKPAREKEPKRQRPGKILKGKAVAQRENKDVDSGNRGAELDRQTAKPTQPTNQDAKREANFPSVLEQKQDWRVGDCWPFVRRRQNGK